MRDNSSNPVALLIPRHRVIQQSGALGAYRWRPAKKVDGTNMGKNTGWTGFVIARPYKRSKP